jgi:signal transduction histidine kinase
MKHPFKDIEVFELSDSFKFAQRNCRYSADTGFTLKFDELGQVQGDRGLINQLAVNLINNSVKYARPNVEALIHVTSEVDGEFLRVHVKDNGVGISPKHIGSVFEPLYRAPTKKPTAKGTGLGLSICKSIVEAHGGEISVTSTTLNDGAVFSFTLPLPAAQFLGGSPEDLAEAEAFSETVNGPH